MRVIIIIAESDHNCLAASRVLGERFAAAFCVVVAANSTMGAHNDRRHPLGYEVEGMRWQGRLVITTML